MSSDVPAGLCQCGCGEATWVATKTSPSHGWVKGQPVAYRRGHDKRKHRHGELCTVSGCARVPEARGLCHSHFEYRRRHGITPTGPILDNDRDRFLAKITVLASGHWIWRGALAGNKQYGQVSYEGRVQGAHRVAWMLYRGPIPDGHEIDHLCRKTLCVNPEHLEPVPPRLNNMRSDSPSAKNGAKTHCNRGHEFTPENIRTTSQGGRACIACATTPEARAAQAARQRAYRARKMAGAPASA